MRPPRRLAASGAAFAAASILGCPLIAAAVGGQAATGGEGRSPTAPPPPAPPPETVPRSEYERVRQKSQRRLLGWRRAERQRERLRRAIRLRIDYVSAGLRCIHTLEGSWRDSGNPYWGGLQMDWGFMRAYGRPLLQRYGAANHWPPEAQIAVGVVAFYSGRGFGPWPNTRRGCGL